MTRGWQALLVAGVCASTAISGSSVGVAASTTPPVVSITLSGNNSKIAGAKHLRPGWTTISLTSTKGDHPLWLYELRGGGTKGAHTASAVHRIRAEDPAGGTSDQTAPPEQAPPAQQPQTAEQAAAAERAQTASDVTESEKAILALGGAEVVKSRPVSMTLKLPAGDVYVVDLGSESDQPVTVLHISGSTTKAAPSTKVSARITEDDHNTLLSSVKKLPHKGTLQISNIGTSRYGWHQVVLMRLAPGATTRDVVKFYASDNPDTLPLVVTDVASSAPLSAKHSQLLTYSLPKGNYVLLDTWLDHSKGVFLCTLGGITKVTLS